MGNATSGLVLNWTVHNTPEGDITYTNIQAGETVLCGSSRGVWTRWSARPVRAR